MTNENQELSFGTGNGQIQTLESFLSPEDIQEPVEGQEEIVDDLLDEIAVELPTKGKPEETIELTEAPTQSMFKDMIDRMVALGEWKPLDVIEDEESYEI